MIGRIAEIASNGRHLACHRGFMTVGDGNVEIARIPFDDLGAVIANAYGLTYSNNLLSALAEKGIPLIVCGSNHAPVGMLWPLDSHHNQAGRIDEQIASRLTTRKRLWADLVRAKVLQQQVVLEAVGSPSPKLAILARKLRTGDPENVESQSARVYWPLLFGSTFRRVRDQPGVNALLNYGYTILRAAMSRAVAGAGLHPSIGLHHSNRSNAMRLVDDLMEPFRPYIDLRVHALVAKGITEVESRSKQALVEVLFTDLHTKTGRSPVTVCMQQLVTTLALVFGRKRTTLELPVPQVPRFPLIQV